jgi:hypothetical protein
MHLKVLTQNQKKGEILVQCLTNWYEMILWRNLHDKLLFRIKQIEEDKTMVDIFIVKNLMFMITLGKYEKRLVDLDKLVSRLKE